MGSISAMSSLDRVLEAHGDQIVADLEADMPSEMRAAGAKITLENDVYRVGVSYTFPGGEVLQGRDIDIDDLAEAYPDCEVGY